MVISCKQLDSLVGHAGVAFTVAIVSVVVIAFVVKGPGRRAVNSKL